MSVFTANKAFSLFLDAFRAIPEHERNELQKSLDDAHVDTSRGDLWNDDSTHTSALFSRLGLGGKHSASGSGAAEMTSQFSASTSAGGNHMMSAVFGKIMDRIEGIEKAMKSIPALASVVSELAKDRFPEDERKDGSRDEEKEKDDGNETSKKAAAAELAAAESTGETVLTMQLKSMFDRISGQRIAKAAKDADPLKSPPNLMADHGRVVSIESMIDELSDQCGTPRETTALATLNSRIAQLKAGKITRQQFDTAPLDRTPQVDQVLAQLH